MGRTFTVHELLNKKFKMAEFEKELTNIIGQAPINFRMMVWGDSGNGKSTLVATIVRLLCNHGKLYYNSTEEGESKSLQDLAIRTNLKDIRKGQLIFAERDTFEEMVARLERNRAKFAALDSVQDANFTKPQFDVMRYKFKNKGLMFISWAEGKHPKGEHAKAIRYLCDIKIYVSKGIAYIDSRYGYTEPYKIPYVYEKFRKGRKIQQQLESPEQGDLFNQ